MRSKIEGCQLHFLSFAGRAERIKGVLHNPVNYWVFSFKLPGSVIKELERIFFFLISYGGDVCMGGIGKISVDQKLKAELGSEDSKDINQVSIIRLVWRLCRSNTLRPTWMNTHNLKGNHLVQASATILDSGTWKWICSLKTNSCIVKYG